MNKGRLAVLFNEWMRRYLADREAFDKRFEELVADFKATHGSDKEPSYGETIASYLIELDGQVPQ